MLYRLKDQIGSAGLIVAVVALVAALGGGAYAASNSGGDNATASAKKKAKATKGPRGPKGPKGAKGDTGPAGPQGAKGDKGDAGANGQDGAKGSNGTNGTSATVTPEDPGANCMAGGVKVDSASPDAYVCNGEEGPEGSPWAAGGTLPPGQTETGTFYGSLAAAGAGFAPLSFSIPLSEFKYADVVDGTAAEIVPEGDPSTDGCPGTVISPTAIASAAKPKLCIYVGKKSATVSLLPLAFGAISGANQGSSDIRSGALLSFIATGGAGNISGTFAVTEKTGS